MPLTRIKTNQISDSSVTTEKVDDGAITDDKLDNTDPIDYGSIAE